MTGGTGSERKWWFKGTSCWVNKSWSFYDGSRNHTFWSYLCLISADATQYNNYIIGVEALCRNVRANSGWGWFPSAGVDSNWQEFGIPNCAAAPKVQDEPGYGGGGGGNNQNTLGSGSSAYWSSKTWYLVNGTSFSSYVLSTNNTYHPGNPTYDDYIISVATQCASKTTYTWSNNAGSDSNWREFGIPVCQ